MSVHTTIFLTPIPLVSVHATAVFAVSMVTPVHGTPPMAMVTSAALSPKLPPIRVYEHVMCAVYVYACCVVCMSVVLCVYVCGWRLFVIDYNTIYNKTTTGCG